MAKRIVINIDTLNITMGHTSTAMLDRLLAAATEVTVEHIEHVDPADSANDAQPAQVSTTTEPSKQDVLDFLAADPRYTQRSFSAIDDHFEQASTPLLRELLAEMWHERLVDTKTRRADGAVLYYALPATPAGEQSDAPVVEHFTPATELNCDAVRAFLASNPEYTTRSREALHMHFRTYPVDEIDSVLEIMEDDGVITRLTRRLDGVPLYKLAA